MADAKGRGAANDAAVSTGDGAQFGPDPNTPEFAADEVKRLRGKLRKQQAHVKATEKALADAERRAGKG